MLPVEFLPAFGLTFSATVMNHATPGTFSESLSIFCPPQAAVAVLIVFVGGDGVGEGRSSQNCLTRLIVNKLFLFHLFKVDNFVDPG